MSSRAGDTGSSSLMVGTSPLKRRWQWHLRHYRCASAWFAPDLNLATQQRAPLSHAGEAHPLDWPLLSQYRRRVEPSPLVAHLEAYLSPRCVSATHTALVWACFCTLLSASWVTLKSVISTAVTNPKSSSVVGLRPLTILLPSCTVCRTSSSGRSSSPGLTLEPGG